jgi:hypothetical protein
MNIFAIIFLTVAGFGLLFNAICLGILVGLRRGCEVWADPESYDNLYGPEGTLKPGPIQRLLFRWVD